MNIGKRAHVHRLKNRLLAKPTSYPLFRVRKNAVIEPFVWLTQLVA